MGTGDYEGLNEAFEDKQNDSEWIAKAYLYCPMGDH